MIPRTISQTKSAVAQGTTAASLCTEILNDIAQRNSQYNAFLGVFDTVMDQAQLADARIQSGDQSPLLGVPIAIKDNILMSGEIASAGSQILGNHRAVRDSFVVDRLRQAGAIIIGRTNMDEFAMGSSTENSAYGPSRNPIDTTRAPGGSSGGSAAAVAAGFVPVSLGSDTGGSIRQPAAFCGLVGLYPTYGAVSRSGIIALASSLDQVGPFAHTVDDAQTLFQVISGYDTSEATSVPDTGRTVYRTPETSQLRIGIPKMVRETLSGEMATLFERTITQLQSLGVTVVDVDIPHMDIALPVYYIIQPAEASSNLARFDGVRYGVRGSNDALWDMYIQSKTNGFGPETQRRILLGTYVLSAGYRDAYYGSATRMRQVLSAEFQSAFALVDVLVTPTTPTTAFALGAIHDPLDMYKADLYTVAANLVGMPALSVPNGQDSIGLPSGFQIIGPKWSESLLFDIGRIIEGFRASQ